MKPRAVPRDLTDYYVLDALADDIESLEQIIPSVRLAAAMWESDLDPQCVSRALVIPALLRLLREQSVVAFQYTSSGKELQELPPGVIPDGNFDDHWFGLTSAGRMLHSAWEPPPERRNLGIIPPAV
jgi:hypothetical protein